MSPLQGFIEAREIWQVPLAASVVAGALLGALGVYVVLRRTVFVSAALTQLSTLGMVVALLVEERIHIETEHPSEQLAVAVAFSIAGALILGAWRSRRLPAEASVGAGWVVASALVVLGTSRLVHAAHDLSGMVFGNAVAVSATELGVLAAVFVVALVVHVLFEKELVFSSFDPETARALGVRVGLWDTVLFASVGVAIPPAARALGALPVFALLTLPAAGALLAGTRLRAAFVIAGVTGVLAAGGGYLFSWFAETPTGATMVVAAAAFVLPAVALRALRR
ncbi:MAG TPA: metal ABC transporter permease [Anaeromyxobacteraceae bacterium]|nr:metal ABC transporter permease [Anaeromyxobacteraceae bacterium]